MNKSVIKLVPVILLISLCSCASFPFWNASGKASKLKCLYFLPDSMKLVYNCRGEQKVASLTIIDDSESSRQPIYFKNRLEPAVSEYRIPINKDSLSNKTFRILISITESNWREGYTIYVKPEDFIAKGKVYCRYSPL